MRNLARALYLVVFVLLAVSVSFAQAPAPLPGYTIQISAGYSNVQGAGASGTFQSLAVPIWTRNSTNTVTFSARADNFFVTSPSTYVITAGPEFRSQFSKADLLQGAVFQPFANVGFGAARSSCVFAMDCAAGQDVSSHFAYKMGGGLDMIMSSNTVARLFEVDYIHSTVFPGNHVTFSNFAQITAGIGFRF